MEYRIGLIHGDGIGPEIVDEAKKVLDAVCEKYGHKFEYTNLLLGGASIDVHGVPLTDETIEEAKKCDAVLMGSIGGDAKTSPWYKLSPDKRPEAGLLKIRKSLGLFANLRPAYLYQELKDACPLKEEVIKCLKESIYELSVDERKCFISYYYYTKTIAVIAEETGLKESTVKSKLLRGRKKLKLKMEKKGFRYEDCKIFFE